MRDLVATDSTGRSAANIAWTHRRIGSADVYFVSNQTGNARSLNISLRETGREPEIADAAASEQYISTDWKIENGRTELPLSLPPYGSVFIVLEKPATKAKPRTSLARRTKNEPSQTIDGPWSVRFDQHYGGPADTVTFTNLTDWSTHAQPGIQYYSGTAVYHVDFIWDGSTETRMFLDLGDVANIAEVTLNGRACGIAWTAPYRVDVTQVLEQGINKLDIAVTNTWANRLIGDHALPEDKRITWTTAPYRLEKKTTAQGRLARTG